MDAPIHMHPDIFMTVVYASQTGQNRTPWSKPVQNENLGAKKSHRLGHVYIVADPHSRRQAGLERSSRPVMLFQST